MAQKTQNVEKDFEELLTLFNKHKVEYCIIGAFAVGFHAIPRYTKDLDIFVRPHIQNGAKIVAALRDFGFGSLKISEDDFSKPGAIIQLGHPPVRVDLLTTIDGCQFDAVWKGKVCGSLGDQSVYYIGLSELMKCKKAAGRSQDVADLVVLGKVKAKQKKAHE